MKKKILVVDDEDFQRDLLNKLLTKSGYTVSEAERIFPS
jgi:CheY-like chemotaxis protein